MDLVSNAQNLLGTFFFLQDFGFGFGIGLLNGGRFQILLNKSYTETCEKKGVLTFSLRAKLYVTISCSYTDTCVSNVSTSEQRISFRI